MKAHLNLVLLFAVFVVVNGSPYVRNRRSPQFTGVNTLPFYFNNPTVTSFGYGSTGFNFRPPYYSPNFNGYQPHVYTPNYGGYNGYPPFTRFP